MADKIDKALPNVKETIHVESPEEIEIEETKKLQEINIDKNKDEKDIVYIPLAGRSNALSGFVAANSDSPTLACPPFKDKTDMLVNIHSTLQMPSNTPVLTVLDPGNCALAVKRILGE